MPNPKTGRLQKKMITLDSTTLGQKEASQATVSTGSPMLKRPASYQLLARIHMISCIVLQPQVWITERMCR